MAVDAKFITGNQARSGSWLIIFTDLVSLMLTFFVLLFSMSNIKVDKWESITDSLSQSLSPTSSKKIAAATAQFNIASIFRKRAINLDYLSALLREVVPKDPLLAQGKLISLEDRLIITLPGRILFAEGESQLKEKARSKTWKDIEKVRGKMEEVREKRQAIIEKISHWQEKASTREAMKKNESEESDSDSDSAEAEEEQKCPKRSRSASRSKESTASSMSVPVNGLNLDVDEIARQIGDIDVSE